MSGTNDWKYFTEKELGCKGTGECFMDKEFMKQLILLREDYGKPMVITSGYRSPEYNAAADPTVRPQHASQHRFQ